MILGYILLAIAIICITVLAFLGFKVKKKEIELKEKFQEQIPEKKTRRQRRNLFKFQGGTRYRKAPTKSN